MKTIKWFISAALAFGLFVPVVKGFIFNIDGTADPGYGSAVSTQAIGTSAGDNTETNQGLNVGSELDAAYGVISNGYLYLVVAGNFASDPASDNPINDETHVFFMTDTGQPGDHTLGTNYSAYAGGRINALGVNGGTLNTGGPGLTFDTTFTPNYWIGWNVGEPTPPNGTPPVMFADYQVVCSNCPSFFLGSVIATNTPPNNVLLSQNNGQASGIELAILTTNTAGVDATTCATNAAGALQSVGAAAVRTGVELAIPLASLGNPTGQVSICVFITDQFCDTLYNQVLGPVWDGTSTYCNSQFALGVPSEANFSTLPGQHYFTLTVPPCNVISVTPTSGSYSELGGKSNETVTLNGSFCGWSVSSDSPWLTIPLPNVGVSGGSFTYSVATNLSINPRVGTLTIAGTIVTQTVSIAQSGSTLPPLGIVTVDGTADAVYGCPLAVQQIGTAFGKNTSTNLQGNGGGSELDAAYGIVQNHVLFLFLAGNLENNFNDLSVFFMTGPGGQSTLTNLQPTAIGRNILNNMSSYGSNSNNPGLTFDPGFAPNYWLGLNGGNSPYNLYVDYAQLWPGGTNAAGVATNGYFLGSTTSTNGTLATGTNPFGVQITINDSNTNGVSGGPGGGTGCLTNAAGSLESSNAALVGTGIELGIPLGAIGNPTGQIAVCVFIANPDGTYMSDQFLGPLAPTGTITCQANLGTVTNTAGIKLGNFPGQHFFWVGPEPRITSISIPSGTTNVAISYVTENNTNMFYRLERTTSPLTIATTNPAVWTPVTGNIAGTNVTITVTDTKAATNKPALFYRVQQTPQCTTP